MRRVVIVAFGVVVLCCSGDERARDGDEWRGTVTSAENVTTVVNESGSVWGAPARLVEQASIGVAEGSEDQMLGSVSSVAYDGERIVVADPQVPMVRVYDADGRHMSDIGGVGQGPGEYERPASVAIADDGRILVRDDRGRRILVYSTTGENLETYPLSGGLQTDTQMVISRQGAPYAIVIVERLADDPNRLWILGMQAHGLEGPYGDPIVPPEYDFERGTLVARSDGGTSMNRVPFWPFESWTLTRDLAIVSGVSNVYRFEVRHATGEILVVERRVEPVTVQPDEAGWYRHRVTAQMRSMVPDWTWNGPPIPETKPAFEQLMAARSGEFWVRRPGSGERIEPCSEEADEPGEFAAQPCWRERPILDVFGPDGRFHGTLAVPQGLRFFPEPHIEGDQVVAVVEDEVGTIQVKRYLIVRDSDL